jgi:hypothetical protein
MTELYVDPDGLTAVAEVARRQHDHVGRVTDYISSTCGRFDAFSGVLNIFEGSYRSTVTSALDGMRDGQTIATKVEETVTACRNDYLDTDREAYEEMKGLFGDMDGFPPYEPPGSGRTTPEGPLSSPPPPGSAPEDDDPFSLPSPPPYVDGPLGRVLPGPDDTVPGVLDPTGAAKEAAVDAHRQHQVEQRYLEYRAQGMTPAEATAAATRDADDIARQHVDDTTRARTESAYDDAYRSAYDDARAQGRTEDEARDAARDAGQGAAQDQNRADTEETRQRRDVSDAAGTYKGAYDTVNETIGGVQDLVDGTQQLEETTEDLGDYDDYEDSGASSDRSAQDWGRR